MVQRLTALLSLGAMIMTNVHADNMDVASRELTRHTTGNAPEELNVNAKDTFNPNFMKDMFSSCRPEKDGYFGSTYGEPVRLTYGFRIETKPLSSIVDMIDLVEDRIVDNVLSQSFPNLCGFGGRRLNKGRASGFRFLKLVGKDECSPTVSGFDFCAVFSGQVNLYGANSAQASANVYEMIREALTPEEASMIHTDIVAIRIDDGQFGLTGNIDGEEDSNANTIGYICFGIAAVIFGIIFYWKCIYNKKEMDTGTNNRGLYNGDNIMPSYDDDVSEFGKLNTGSYERPIAVGFSDAGSVYSDYKDEYQMEDPDII
ncbi:unnamed protein product [Cylindrotheca closterium]|uniref:SEA domain-containing protein n=1 Tax=Cylindrotheca closterium TaxID=2856 RepID=A0AAD2CA43_9STRA|nr:unnamed protein product [Cylindrotheca closterium]